MAMGLKVISYFYRKSFSTGIKYVWAGGASRGGAQFQSTSLALWLSEVSPHA